MLSLCFFLSILIYFIISCNAKDQFLVSIGDCFLLYRYLEVESELLWENLLESELL